MYTLDCSYYTKSFSSLNELLDDILNSGMDPNYTILKNNIPTGETAWDLIGPEAWLISGFIFLSKPIALYLS